MMSGRRKFTFAADLPGSSATGATFDMHVTLAAVRHFPTVDTTRAARERRTTEALWGLSVGQDEQEGPDEMEADRDSQEILFVL